MSVLLLFCAVSTSDYYVVELGQAEPACVGKLFTVAMLLAIPQILHMIKIYWKEFTQ